jgi:hypothetical protein
MKGINTKTHDIGVQPASQIKFKTHVQKMMYTIFKTKIIKELEVLQLIFPAQYVCSMPTFWIIIRITNTEEMTKYTIAGAHKSSVNPIAI